MTRKPTHRERKKKVKEPEKDLPYRKQLEDALSESEERYRLLAENVTDVIWTLDMNLRFTYISPSIKGLLGYSVEEAMARTLEEGLTPASLELAMRVLAEELAVEEKEDKDLSRSRTLVLEQNCRDGSTVWTEDRITFLRDPNGRPSGILGVTRDITERKRAQEALRESEEKYRQLFCTESDAILLFYADTGEFLDVNEAALRLYGYSMEEFLKLKILDVSADSEATRSSVEEAIVGNLSKIRLLYHKRKDGRTLPVEISVGTFVLRGRKVLCGAVRNIEERMRMEEELRKHRDHLERRVAARTAELNTANEQLRKEIAERKRTEEALKESEARFRNFLDNLGDVAYETDASGQVTYANRMAERITGVPSAEIIGKPYSPLLGNESQGPAADAYQKTLNGESIEYELTFRNKRIFHFKNNPLTNERGEIIGVFGTARDITERKTAENALRENEERFRALFEGSLDAVFLADPESGEILDANPAARELLLRPKEEILGLYMWQLHPPRLETTVRKTYESRAHDEERNHPVETCVLRSDGGEVPVEILAHTIQISGAPMVYSVFRDITERKKAEKALQESEEMYRTLVQTSPDAITVTDLQGVITGVSQRALEQYGFEPTDEIIGRSAFEFIDPDDQTRAKAGLRTLLEEGTLRNAEYTLLRKDGSTFIGEMNGAVIRDAQGRPTSFIVATRDITERRRWEAELSKVQTLKSLGILAGGIAHDFNNILTAILANISMVRLYGILSDDVSEMLSEAEKASLRAKGLTQQLLAFAKGGVPIKKPVSISRAIRDTAEFALSGSNVRCEYSIPEDLWMAEVDEVQISQVIQNLIVNADQAMAEGGIIQVLAENVVVRDEEHVDLKGGRYVKVSVTDQGSGIPEKQISRIFDPFFTTKEQGRGLGLALTYSIVNRHDGHIHVDSRTGVGTTFHVFLPTSEGKAQTEPKAKEPARKGEGRILVIDDEEMIRKSAGEMLRRLGYEVELAKDGAEGIEGFQKARASERPFGAIIMDITIRGGMGGEEAIRELRRIDPETKVVVSSGYSDDPIMTNFREYGFSSALRKPYTSEELAEAIQKAIIGADG